MCPALPMNLREAEVGETECQLPHTLGQHRTAATTRSGDTDGKKQVNLHTHVPSTRIHSSLRVETQRPPTGGTHTHTTCPPCMGTSLGHGQEQGAHTC